jgi:uncharacterized repeat protein (TIGR03803 family)
MTPNGGTSSGVLFKMNADGTGFQILHDFGNNTDTDGTLPRASLTLSGSTLYGCTAYGDTFNGTVFKINADGTGYQIVANFPSGTNGINTQGHPYGAPILSGSTLYGMVSSESSGLNGAIYAVNVDAVNAPITSFLYEFGGPPNDGAAPYGSLTLSGSTLYGMTSTGGSSSGGTGSGYGVIFRINTDGSGYQIMHEFSGSPSDGANPYGSLTLSGSTLYGMTSAGGLAGSGGVIFQISTVKNTDGTYPYQVLHNFALNSSDDSESSPYGSLALSGSTLYGMTYGGGGASGSIFEINTDGTGFQLLHGFNASQVDGGQPYGDVTLLGATLYGMTYAGGSAGKGVIFSLDTLPPGIPRVTTLPTGRIVDTNTITVSGMVNPNGEATTYWFEYGTRAAKLTPISPQTLPPLTAENAVNTQLIGLTPLTVYYFRIVAQNSAGTSEGRILEFRTSGQKTKSGSTPETSTDSAEFSTGTTAASSVSSPFATVRNPGTKSTAGTTISTQTATLEVTPGRSTPLVMSLAGIIEGIPATATCTHLPEGAICSYDSNSQTMTITPSENTPRGSYPIHITVTTESGVD